MLTELSDVMLNLFQKYLYLEFDMNNDDFSRKDYIITMKH